MEYFRERLHRLVLEGVKKKMEMKRVILAMDLSLNGTGYAVMEFGTGKVIEMGTIVGKRNENHHRKLKRQYETFTELKDKYEAKGYRVIAVKEQLLFRPPKTASILAKVHGITDLVFPKIHEFYPSTVKKVVSGNGAANKDEVEEGIRDVLGKRADGLVFDTDDESDAVAVGLTYLIENKRFTAVE